MTDAQIISALGGIRPVARLLGHRWHTRVQYWFEKNRIADPEAKEALLKAVDAKRASDGEAA